MARPKREVLDEFRTKWLLSLDEDDLAWLENTGRLNPVIVVGERLYLWRQVLDLVCDSTWRSRKHE